MSHYLAIIKWERNGADFLANRYSREHVWEFDGGAIVAASASPHIVPLPYSNAANVDPEEAFVAALSSCHMLFFLDLASRAGFEIEHYLDKAEGVMGKNDQGKIAMIRVTLQPAVTFTGANHPDRAAIEQLHHKAHTLCFIANSVTTEVIVSPRD